MREQRYGLFPDAQARAAYVGLFVLFHRIYGTFHDDGVGMGRRSCNTRLSNKEQDPSFHIKSTVSDSTEINDPYIIKLAARWGGFDF